MTSSSDVLAPRSMKELIIPGEQITMLEKLGEGEFAVVRKGDWDRGNGLVAVALKVLRDCSTSTMGDLREEISSLNKLQHPSLVRLHGFVTDPPMMVFELCEGGSLLDRLRDDQKPIPLVSRLHDYCIQIAKALQFLESKHCVHRDVAARNILLAKDEKILKISDFGLLRALEENEQVNTMASHKKVPFAWCPPEALRHRKFSHASDVWSYGVTIWEIFTFGEEPWVGCRPMDVLDCIDAGERLEKPKYCSERIYQIMKDCWKSNPADRCKFGAIQEDLKTTMFLNAIARETYNSIQPGTLQLVKGDEVVVVENTGQDWFGQNKKNQLFGTFPRSVVFAQTSAGPTPSTTVLAKPASQPLQQSAPAKWKNFTPVPGTDVDYNSLSKPPSFASCCMQKCNGDRGAPLQDCTCANFEACLDLNKFDTKEKIGKAYFVKVTDCQFVCMSCHGRTGCQMPQKKRSTSTELSLMNAAEHLVSESCGRRKKADKGRIVNIFIFYWSQEGILFANSQYNKRGGRFDYRRFDALAQHQDEVDIANMNDYTKFVTKSNDILWEDDYIQIGCKLETRNNLGRLDMSYGNKTSQPFNKFTPIITCPGALAVQLQAQAKPMEQIVAAGTRVEQLINFVCVQEFQTMPTMNIKFSFTDRAGALQNFDKNFYLPLFISKFFEPTNMTSEQFFTKWKSLGAASQEVQKIFNAQSSIEKANIETKLKGFGANFLTDVDPNPDNYACAGIIHTQTQHIRTLIRLEPNKQAKMYHLTIRSSKDTVVQTLVDLLANQF